MTHTYLTRRWLLAVAGGGTLAAATAGCSGDPEPSADATPDENSGGAQNDAGIDTEDWKNVEEFQFEGRADAWTGIEPAVIDGVENPTIVLFDGDEYDFRWENADGAIHNLEIWDEDGNVVADYVTDSGDTEGEEVALTNLVASQDMASYVCVYHQGAQSGEIDVRSR